MKRLFISLFISLFSIGFILVACENKNKFKETEQSKKLNEKNINRVKNLEVLKDTLSFQSYNDYADYMLLDAKKGSDIFSFINDKITDRSLLRGDICEINWVKDTIYIAGDGETPEIADWILSINKIKDGNVSKFRKQYKNELKYHFSNPEDYSDDYLNQIYLIAEYYIANSKNELIKNAVKEKSVIEYSIEFLKRNNIGYEVLGIGKTFENKFNIMQWIYIDRESNKIFEYDLANDILKEFN